MRVKKKLFLTFLILIFVINVFLGCNILKNKNPKVENIVASISDKVNLHSLKKGDKLALRKYYRIDPSKLEEFQLYLPSSNMDVTEILIAKCKDQDFIEEINEKIENRIEKQKEAFKDYAPKQYSLIENHILFHKGNYVVMIITENEEELIKNIKKQF